MQGLLTLFLLLVAGYTFRKTRWGARRALQWSQWLNRWVIRVALPALVFAKIQSLPDFSLALPEIYLPILQPWIQFFVSLMVLTVLARVLGWSRGVWACLVLTVGLGNTSFVGIPLLLSLIGQESLSTAILQDQLGSFLILSLVGVPFGQMISIRHSGKRPRGIQLLLKPIRFPAFMALIAALLLSKVSFPAMVEWGFSALSSTLAPAAILSVGMMLSFSALRRREVRSPLWVGLALKLALLPLLWFQLFPAWADRLGGIPPVVLQTLLLEGAMASQITAGLVASEYGHEPDLSRLMVGLSIPISLVTVPLWAAVPL